jgi:uncharacterized protein YkwD
MGRVFACLLCLCALPSLADPEALARLNEMRADQGRPPLSYAPVLEGVALKHAQELARRQVLSHEGENGSSAGDRVRAAGYGWCRVAENIAKGPQDLNHALQMWHRSRPHARNMYDRHMREFGVAKTSDGYWVMVLAKPGCGG